MRLADALQVQAGDALASPFTSPAYRPFIVKAVWVSADRRFVRFQLKGFKPAGAWIGHDNLVRIPAGWEWTPRQGWIDSNGVPGTLHLTQDPEPAELT